MEKIYEKNKCKACGTANLRKFISFGKMPIGNAFLKENDLRKDEYFYDMEVGFCELCKMVQLIEIPSYDKYIVPDETGKTNYAFFSSTSKFMEQHFADMAKDIELRFLDGNSRVLEIGSNDGIMLKAFKNNKTLGVEPSENVAEIAIKQGIETLVEFFDEVLAGKILAEKGKFKAILSTNVFLNIIDINSAIRGIKKLLEDRGVFVTEDPYIIDILEKNSYDQIYDEHVWYFSLTSLNNMCKMHGLEVFDAERQEVHGGSMRVFMCKSGMYGKTERLRKYMEEETKKGVDNFELYLKFKENVEKNRLQLKNLLQQLKEQGKKIVGYGAASKGTIVLNYCNIGKETLDYISDNTEFKQGKFSPGKHILVVSPDKFHEDKADYALLSAWNHAKEIIGKEKDFVKRGGRFVVHLPYPHVVQPGEFDENYEENKDKEVEFKDLKIFVNDQGYLFETVRNDDRIFDKKFGQVLVSVLYPGTIKGLHLHHKQTDYTTCIKGNIKYVVAKEKENGETEVKTYILGENNRKLIKTPPEHWHGYMPLGNQEAIVLHLMDKTFDVNDPDTERKDYLAFGDVWSVKPS